MRSIWMVSSSMAARLSFLPASRAASVIWSPSEWMLLRWPPAWSSTASPIWSPTVCRADSEVIGS